MTPPIYLTDVRRATNLLANPPYTKGSATTAIKPANRMQAVTFILRQECRSRASTANEKISRQSAGLGADFTGGVAFRVESDRNPAASTDKGCFTKLKESGKDKGLQVIIVLWEASEVPTLRAL